jgi:hypothetical protein
MEEHQSENKKIRINNNGYVALIGVLIVGAVGLAIALAVIISGTDSLRSTDSIQNSAKARSLANACTEEALKQIRISTSFEGTGQLSLSNASCSFEVIKETGQERTIQSVGNFNSETRKVEVSIENINPDIIIVYWQEVTAF